MPGGNKFSSTNQPDAAAREKGAHIQRANACLREALENAFDKLGNEAIFLELWRGNPIYKTLPPSLAAKLLAEDRRAFVVVLSKLLPIQVAGSVDSTLTVKIVTQVGEQEIDVTPAHWFKKKIPQAATGHAPGVPVPSVGGVPAEPHA